MTVTQLIGGTVSNGLTNTSSEWNTTNRMTGSFCSGQPRGPPNFVALVDRKRLSHGGVFRHCSLATNHETMSFPSRLARQRKHNFSVVSNQLSSDCGVHSSSYVDESSTVEEHCLTSSIDVFTENPSCQPHVRNVKQELIMLSLPAIAGQAIEPLAQLMETAYIGRLGSVELASAGVSMSIFNIISKLFNIPLLSVATSFVAEDISTIASRTSAAGEHCQRESGNGKPFDVINICQQLSSVSTALVLAAAIGIFEALALSLGSGLFLSLLGISPDSSMRVPEQRFLCLRALGAPAVVVSLALQGIFRGFKDTKTPVSRYIVTFLMIWHLNKRAVLLPPMLRDLQFGGYIKSGGFLIGRTLAVLVTMTLGTSMAARQGTVAMAAHQICLLVWLAVSLLTDALVASGQALIASSYSKGDYRTSREVANFALKDCSQGFLGCNFGFIFWFFSHLIH